MFGGKSPEPLSREALRVLRRYPHDTREIRELFGFMTTQRTDRVYDELRRYCNGEQDGVSILISGTRGMGKTTLAKLVVQKLIAEDGGLIPLPLVLHGPTLLRPDAESLRVPAPKPLTWAEEKHAEEFEKVRLKQWVLRQLIAALYRHLCTHIVEAWENATESATIRAGSRRADRLRAEMRQLRAHLEHKLDEAPSIVTLRKIWRRGEFLQSGVLPGLYACRTPRSWPEDQGIREIAALSACALSYLTIIGAPQETVSSVTASTATTRTATTGPAQPEAKHQKAGDEEAKGGGAAEQVKRIGPPALATVATTAIGIAHPDGWALAAGLLVYLLGVASSRFTLRRDQFAELRRNLVVTVDWSERRLERELPTLLRRVKHAGFAPIFILDELDKLDDDVKTLHAFLDFAKHIVREHAAFLFLSHRDYFERLLPRSQDIPGA